MSNKTERVLTHKALAAKHGSTLEESNPHEMSRDHNGQIPIALSSISDGVISSQSAILCSLSDSPIFLACAKCASSSNHFFCV